MGPMLYHNVSSAVCLSWVMGEIIIYSFENEPPIDQFLVTGAILVWGPWQWQQNPQKPKLETFFYFKSDYDELFHQILEHDREMNRPFAHKPTLNLELCIFDYSYSLPSGQTWYLPLQCRNRTIFIFVPLPLYQQVPRLINVNVQKAYSFPCRVWTRQDQYFIQKKKSFS